MKKILFLALGAASFSACKKESAVVPQEVSTITAPNWRVSAAATTTMVVTTTATPTTTTQTVDDFAQQPACRKDDFSKFNTDGTLAVDEGATKCGTTDPQRVTNRWVFSADRTQLMITPAGTSQAVTYDVVELSSKTLRLRRTTGIAAGNTTTSTITNTTYTAF